MSLATKEVALDSRHIRSVDHTVPHELGPHPGTLCGAIRRGSSMCSTVGTWGHTQCQKSSETRFMPASGRGCHETVRLLAMVSGCELALCHSLPGTTTASVPGVYRTLNHAPCRERRTLHRGNADKDLLAAPSVLST